MLEMGQDRMKHFEKIRADEGDLVSEELRKRATQCIQRSVINQAVVWISRGEEFDLQNSIYGGG